MKIIIHIEKRKDKPVEQRLKELKEGKRSPRFELLNIGGTVTEKRDD